MAEGTVKDCLENYLKAYKSDSIQKIRDEKMQLVTASEFVQLHQEKLAAEREVEKLKKDNEAMKKALTEISDGIAEVSIDDFNNSSKASVASIYAEQALAAIGM
ncbi:hypothetical protein [Lactococcus kimchii]|uniref:hypothetical protein n=1 Tax=Lactococcus sp. S-13 TaxID=2507158 RepID=UPI001022AE09|nr:hypothetical protein [Lactococcus sp. S-13]RZI47845.1 hypothetical protein EQJ87_11275 [Lactococcus sp. S-13]RZI47902.1 hypothetical protein EQJ87_10805 [Lactococcus sp. S-13]